MSLKNPILYWQYKHSPRYKKLFDDLISTVKKYYPGEIWELLDIDTAKGYALDLIGQRLGYPRPQEFPDTMGIYDIARYEQAYYDQSLDSVSLVKDDTYRYMLKMRIKLWQPWHTITITSFYTALKYAFPDLDFWLYRVPGQPVMHLYILSDMTYPQRRALFSDALNAPIGQTLLIYDAYEDPGVLPQI